MNIAEKLKNTLSEEHVNDKSLDFIYTKSDNEKKSSNKTKINIATIKPKLARLNKFEDLRSKLVAKIENTPYWSDYSIKTKEQLVCKYFETKIKGQDITYSQADKISFITEVLKSVV